LCIAAGVIVGCSAQAPNDLRHWTLSTWTIEQGLPQNFVTSLDQTPDGFLWVGTMGGLARFDGQSFRTSFAGDSPTLHSNITSLGHDRAGQLWVGTASGLLHQHDGAFHLVALPEPGAVHVERMVVAHEGGVLVDTGRNLWLVGQNDTIIRHLPVDAAQLRSFAEDRAGRLWFTNSRVVSVLNQAGHLTTYPLPDAGVLTITGDDAIYAGNGHQLFRFNGRAFVPLGGVGLDEFVDMTVAHDGGMWFASGGLQGLARRDAEGVQQLSIKEGLASNDVRVLLEGHDGSMWVGTIAGLQWLHRGSFTPFSANDGLPSPSAQYDAVFAAHDGAVWAGTLQNGIAVYRGGRWQIFGRAKGVRSGQVRGFADERGPMPLVALSDYGIFHWTGSDYAPIANVPAGYVSAPIRASDGSLWFSIIRGGVFQIHGDTLRHFGPQDGLTESTVWCLLDGGAAGIYAGARTGLFHFDGSRWQRIDPQIQSSVTALWRTSSGELLAGTSAGLDILRDGRMETIAAAQGLPSDSVLQIEEDRDGGLWFANPAGVYRIAHAQIDAFLAHRIAAVSPEIYTERDGLPSRDLLPISGTLAARSADGRIWFATTRGPAAGSWQPEAAPHAIVDNINADGVTLPRHDARIAPGRHSITFAFTAPNFIAPEQVRFRYRLIGWDNAWIEAGKMREVSYSGLPPGTYRLEVQAIGRGDNEGPIATGPGIDLQPFFWQTRLFMLATLAILVIVIVDLTRRGTMLRARRTARRFEERAAERERIAYQIHDTVIQDLIGATLYLEIAEMELAAGDADPQKQLEGLAARLRETVARSRNMVASLHTTAHPQYSLLDVLRLAEAEFRMSDLPAFTLTHTGEPRRLDTLIHDEIYRIGREAIANAFRHASAKHIHVRVAFEPDALGMEITDDGVGMDSETQLRGRPGHFGLPSIRTRSKRIGAHLAIESAPGAGTAVRLSMRSPWTRRAMLALRRLFGRTHH
jgi:signal transduction histidine kinase/ligand-binding sensor domain-containing protein